MSDKNGVFALATAIFAKHGVVRALDPESYEEVALYSLRDEMLRGFRWSVGEIQRITRDLVATLGVTAETYKAPDKCGIRVLHDCSIYLLHILAIWATHVFHPVCDRVFDMYSRTEVMRRRDEFEVRATYELYPRTQVFLPLTFVVSWKP